MCSNCRENHKNQKFSADSKPELEGGQGISQISPFFLNNMILKVV